MSAFESCPLDHYEYENEIHLPKDIRNSSSPEVFLYDTLKQAGLKVYEMTYLHQDNKYNDTLTALTGFHHKNAGARGCACQSAGNESWP